MDIITSPIANIFFQFFLGIIPIAVLSIVVYIPVASFARTLHNALNNW